MDEGVQLPTSSTLPPENIYHHKLLDKHSGARNSTDKLNNADKSQELGRHTLPVIIPQEPSKTTTIAKKSKQKTSDIIEKNLETYKEKEAQSRLRKMLEKLNIQDLKLSRLKILVRNPQMYQETRKYRIKRSQQVQAEGNPRRKSSVLI